MSNFDRTGYQKTIAAVPIPNGGKAVLMAMALYCNEEMLCPKVRFTAEKLARILGIGIHTARHRLKELRASQLLRTAVIKRKAYYVLPSEDRLAQELTKK